MKIEIANAKICVIVTLVALYAFWLVTKHQAVEGSWWKFLFDESGPIMLPIIFGGLLVGLWVVFNEFMLKEKTKLNRSDLYCLLFVFFTWLLIPIAYLNGFETEKIWKDIAFLTAFLLCVVVGQMKKEQALKLFFICLAIFFFTDLLLLAEAIRRMLFFNEPLYSFLLHTYRIIAGEGRLYFIGILLLTGYLIVLKTTQQKIGLLLTIVYFYFIVRFLTDFTRLLWMTLLVSLIVFLVLFLPKIYYRAMFKYLNGIFVVLVSAVIISSLVFPNFNIQKYYFLLYERFASLVQSPHEDVSLGFRITESQLLFDKFTKSIFVGWGTGGTISPNDPNEPERNNISVFFNGWLGILYKVGLIGTVLFLLFFITSARNALITLRRGSGPIEKAVASGILLYMTGAFVTTFLSDMIFANLSGLLIGIMAGITNSLVKNLKTGDNLKI